MQTGVLIVDFLEAPVFRKMLTARVRLLVTESRHMLLWRKFTVTGPQEAVEAALREVDEYLDAEFWARQW